MNIRLYVAATGIGAVIAYFFDVLTLLEMLVFAKLCFGIFVVSTIVSIKSRQGRSVDTDEDEISEAFAGTLREEVTPEAIAMLCHGKRVRVTRKDRRGPKVIRPVTKESVNNRKLVKEGKVTTWGAHGAVAVVTNEAGISAAFHAHELDY